MRREGYALMLLLFIFLATLTLGYGSSFNSGDGGKTRNIISELLRETSNKTEKVSGLDSGINGKPTLMEPSTPHRSGNQEPGIPPTDLKFSPTNLKVQCPVAILPRDPMLVCVKRPAKSVPLISWSFPQDFKMVVWYRGTYYIPYIKSPTGPDYLKGINGRPRYSLDTETPIVVTTYGISKRFRVYTNFTGPLNYTSGLPLKVESWTESGSTVLYTFEIPPLDRNYTPGYYPVFISIQPKTGRTVLLMWIALLEKPFVKITKYPNVLAGNGDLRMPVSGTVVYPNGSPVNDGIITVTLNRTKNTTGTIVGTVRISNGTFNLTAVIPEGETPGSYHIIAHYSGYLAYPSNSDPVVKIKRVPEVRLERLNGTLEIFLNWNGNPLPNRTITIVAGNLSTNLTTDAKGRAFLRIDNATGTIRVVYSGDSLYLPLDRTFKIPPAGKGGKTDSTGKKTRHFPSASQILGLAKLASGLFIGAGLVYVVMKRKNLPKLPLQSPLASEEPLKVLRPTRRVFLLDEPIRIVLNRPAEAFLDGEPLGRGDTFELRPGVGTHVFSSESISFEFYVLPPREAVIKAYNLHFLPYVESRGVPTGRRTPFEIIKDLRGKGLNESALEEIALLFVLADYAERPLKARSFQEFIKALERLGVFDNGDEEG